MTEARLTTTAIWDEVTALLAEAEQIDRDLQSAEMTAARFKEQTEALIEPRIKAAQVLRTAVEAMRLIPPLGTARKPKGKR